MENNIPLVSIVCLTFNHENYLAQCLDSFLMQETQFDYEIFIHDDASTDQTVNIIEKYKEENPKKIKTFYQKENQFSKGKGFIGLRMGFNRAQSKYIAYCEGDDYWTDATKLQKQVDFLESNNDFHVVTHDTIIRNDSDPKKDGVLFSNMLYNLFINKPKKIYTLKDTFTGNIFHISSLMFRNANILFPNWINRFSACDMVLFMLLAKEGNIFYMNNVMSAYRNNVSGVTGTRTEYSSQIRFLNMSIQIVRLMNRYFDRKYQKWIYPVIARYYVELSFLYLKKSNRSLSLAKKVSGLARKYDAGIFIRYSFRGLMRILKNRLS